MIRVAVVGAAGRMGREVLRALTPQEGFEIVAAVGRSGVGTPVQEIAGPAAPDIQLEDKLSAALDRAQPDVIVSFAHYSAAADHAEQATKRGIPFVFGMTGISDPDVRVIKQTCQETGVAGMIVPNFAIGAVLMMRFAELAARWLPDCEIIEKHHDRKEDAPSGTAMLTAQRINNARVEEPMRLPRPAFKVEGARGGKAHNVPVHSIRLPGLLAHQEVIFGGPGEVLTIEHDSLDRAGFMGGVKLCVRRVRSLQGLTVGMDRLLFD